MAHDGRGGRFGARRIARIGAFTALAVALSGLERLMPAFNVAPGVRLGWANLATLGALYLLGGWDALAVSVARAFVSGFLFGSLSSIAYALAGALASLACMARLKRTERFSAVGVSAAGGVVHNMAQLAVAAVVARTPLMVSYLPVLILAGVTAGAVNGLIARVLIPRVQKATQ